jgi:hypothetical protein
MLLCPSEIMRLKESVLNVFLPPEKKKKNSFNEMQNFQFQLLISKSENFHKLLFWRDLIKLATLHYIEMSMN